MNQYPQVSEKEAMWIVEKRMFSEVGNFLRTLKASRNA